MSCALSGDVDSTGELKPVDASQFSVSCGCDGVTPSPSLPDEEGRAPAAATAVPTTPSSRDLGTPTPTASPTAAGARCSNGVPGVQSGDACCAAACGQCGGTGCSSVGGPDLGAADCCATEIVDSGPACADAGIAPCVVGEVSPTSSPTVPTARPSTGAPTASGNGIVEVSPSPTEGGVHGGGGGEKGVTVAPTVAPPEASVAPTSEGEVLSSAGRPAARASSLAAVLGAGVGGLWALLMLVSQ